MIKIQQINDFVYSHFNKNKQDINRKENNVYKGYICHLCYKYSNEVVNTTSLKRFFKHAQHGTIAHCHQNILNGLSVDKRVRLEFGCLEEAFLEKFKIKDYNIVSFNMDEMLVRRKLIEKEQKTLRFKKRNIIL